MPNLFCENHPDDFEEITLHVHENVIRLLRSQITIRAMAGTSFGLADSFLKKLFDEIDKGNTTIEFIRKEDKVKYE